MRIQQLRLTNFRGLKEVIINFPKKGTSIFIGVNGAGKSSILEAISIALNSLLKEVAPDLYSNSPEFNLKTDDINHKSFNVSIYSMLQYHNKLFPYDINFPRTEDKYIPQKIILYLNQVLGITERYPFITFFRSTRKMGEHNKNDRLNKNNIFNKIASFEDFIVWFEERENFENQEKLRLKNFDYIDDDLEPIRSALISFLNKIPNTYFSDLKMKRYEQNGKKADFKSDVKSFLSITKNGETFKLNQLSDGEKMVIMLVSAISRKLVLENVSLTNPLNGEGIVLIDEIDLHLHPTWQRAIIPALEKTFPNIQFIVTTHSPQVLSTVKKENVFILEDFKLVKETPHTYGQDSNSILYNIFGVEKRPEDAAKDFKKLYRLIDDEKLQEAEKMLEEMSEKYGYYDSEIVRAKMHLDFHHH